MCAFQVLLFIDCPTILCLNSKADRFDVKSIQRLCSYDACHT